MRVTQSMLSNQMMQDIQSNYQRLSKLQNEVATGKKVNTPADNPVAIGFIMQYKNDLSSYQQYQSNATAAQGWLKNTQTVMNQAQQTMQRARDLAVQASNGTQSPQDRQTTASEVSQLYQQMVSIGNSQYNGQYVFNGQMTSKAPYTNASAASQNTNTGAVSYDVGTQHPMQVNVSGNSYFGAANASDNAFKILQNLKTALDSNNTTGIQNAITAIDSRTNKMQASQADLAARQDRTKFAASRLSDLTQNVTQLLSNTQDANMAQVITNLQSAQNVQTASLQVGAKVLVPTLNSFLK